MVAVFHSVVRRRPLRTLLARDSATFARRWPGKVLVAVALVAIPIWMVGLSVVGDRYGRYADDSWKALLMLVVLAATYLATRRLLVTVLIGAVTVAVTSWVLAPKLAQTRNGDPTVLAHVDRQASMGWLADYHNVAVAEVDLDAAQQVRLAGIGADETTVMEVGSMTKAMTGLVIADAVDRGEIRMDAPVSTYLPQLKGSAAGTATLHELVTHTAGYAEFGAATLRRAAWKAPLGKGFLTADSEQMTNETRAQTLNDRGRYVYSTLGSAVAGQAVAAAAHMSYPDLMRTRLFEPLGMTDTAIEVDGPLVKGGTTQTGLPAQPWVMDAYAPGAAAVSTTADLAKLATAAPRRDRARHVRPGAHHRDRPVEHPHRRLLVGLHLGERSDDHRPRRADRRLRLLPRHRPRRPQGRHRPLRRRQQRQRPGHRAPHRPRVGHRLRSTGTASGRPEIG